MAFSFVSMESRVKTLHQLIKTTMVGLFVKKVDSFAGMREISGINCQIKIR
jgi:hypothetical protein